MCVSFGKCVCLCVCAPPLYSSVKLIDRSDPWFHSKKDERICDSLQSLLRGSCSVRINVITKEILQK